MKSIRSRTGIWAGALLALLLSGAASALPVTVSGSITSITPGAGYGQDAPGVETVPAGLPPIPGIPAAGTPFPGTQGGTLLDVAFDFALNTFGSITLNAVNVPVTPATIIGTIALRELFIDADEQNDLGVSMGISLVSPVGGPLTMTATGTAIVGAVPPVLDDTAGNPADYTLVWDPIFVPFGVGGLLRIDLETLTFNMTAAEVLANRESRLPQHFTLTLLQDSRVPVPEPGMLTLMGLGLAGLGLIRRRRTR